jgi:hypothetical protein
MTAAAKKAAAAKKKAATAPLTPDTFDPGVLGEDYAFVAELINANPEIQSIYKEATDSGWFDTPAGVSRFKQRIQGSNWYQSNNKYARKAWTAYQLSKQGTGSDYQLMLENARIAIKQKATEMGANPSPERLKQLETQYIYGGWGDAGRSALLDEALSQDIGEQESVGIAGGTSMRGASGNLADSLRRMATENGLNYSDSFYESAAKSVASGLSTADDWARDVQEQAATLWPVYADKIRAGMTAKELASPYAQIWAQTFDQDISQVDINNSDIRKALGGFDDGGNPTAMNLWDFQKMLKEKPEWMRTKQATDQVSGIANDVLRIMGIRG